MCIYHPQASNLWVFFLMSPTKIFATLKFCKFLVQFTGIFPKLRLYSLHNPIVT